MLFHSMQEGMIEVSSFIVSYLFCLHLTAFNNC